ncbi:MAG: hypothetical protein V3V99_05605 [candidate division Zixibacteria bacterium]
MDFSQDVLIEFGLNLAGYLMVAMLVLLLVNRRQARKDGNATEDNTNRVKTRTRQKIDALTQPNPEFMSLKKSRGAASPLDEIVEKQAGHEENIIPVFTSDDRQKNRREIYRQARRLMAEGKSNHELLEQLPLTEDELELISAVGNA